MLHQPTLKPTKETDIALFFQFQLNDEANYMAAFTQQDPTDKVAYLEKYTKHLLDEKFNMQTIYVDEKIVGSMARFIMFGEHCIAYWIDKNYWGKGITTLALQSFLKIENTRPLFSYVAFDNLGSQKVLEKNGFVRFGTDKGYANARKAEIEEFIYKLD